MNFLNQEGKYDALYINIEAAQAERENISGAMRIILIVNALGYESCFKMKEKRVRRVIEHIITSKDDPKDSCWLFRISSFTNNPIAT